VDQFSGGGSKNLNLGFKKSATMKQLSLLITLLLSLMFSHACFAEWVKILTDSKGNTSYVDLDRIKVHGEYIYVWTLIDYLLPDDKYGEMSQIIYSRISCNPLRQQNIQFSSYNGPMGQGISETWNAKNKNWKYPLPNSIAEAELETICDRVK